MIEKLNIAVLCGGASGEREVSLRSGAACHKALLEKGHNARIVDTSDREGLASLITNKPDVAFLALHGKGGEDGTIQGFLETIGVVYTGSGIRASAIAINKSATKEIYKNNDLPTAKSLTFSRDDVPESLLTSDGEAPSIIDVPEVENVVAFVLAECGLPCVIKPTTEGSSLGMTIAKNEEEILSGLALALKVDKEAIVEEFIQGTELTVGVMGYSNPQAFSPIQINVTSEEFYNFEAKYAKGGSTHICPAPITQEQTQVAQDLALAAHMSLGCAGVSRTDMILDKDGRFWLLETNTIPGMTETSLIPDAAAEAGISFADLCESLVEMALYD